MATWISDPTSPSLPFVLLAPLCISVLLGGAVGLERELHGHPAGLRTHMLVALGATLATLVSIAITTLFYDQADPGRVAAQVVTGIGFLGAGAIIRGGTSVRGLTTAASIWTTAMIGMTVGVSFPMAMLGVMATGICVLALWWLHRIQDRIGLHGILEREFDLEVQEDPAATTAVLEAVAAASAEVTGMTMEPVRGTSTRRLLLRIRLAGGAVPDLMARLSAVDGVRRLRCE